MAAAGIAVSVSMGVMKPVLEKLSTLMGDEYKKIKGLRNEVSFLRDELRAMESLLEKMDAADRLDSQAREWRKDIIDMSYDIEDCIDDFMHRVGEASDKVGILQKASGFLKTIKDRYRIANQIKKIKTRVIQTSQRRERYKLDVCISNTTLVVVDPRLSALSKDSTNLVGLENQNEELSKWVNDEEKQLKIMSIVGFGGLGKTTLANEVYRQVGGQLKYKAFVCISQKPDIIKLLKRILFELDLRQYSHDYFVEQDLVDALRKHLQDKRYFIVLDDLWEMEAWDAIQCAFPQNNYCSRVIITTRNDNVAKRCCGTSGIIYNMKPLSEPDARKLFFTRIFGSQDDCPSGFEEVSCAILKRCGGLPLAIITIAGILASQQTKLKEAWEYIQAALAPKLEPNIDYEKMMYILDLSYKHLPLHLKACFLYLGTYPEDHRIDRVELVRRWVAEGFVSNSTGLNVWDAAESYFNELVNRSMVQPVYYGDDEDMMSGCRVHDMMLDLILRKCKEDNFLILVNNPHEAAAGQDKVIRRLTVDLNGVEDSRMVAKNSVGNLSHLRSITILAGGSMWIPVLLEFKFVRVLLLSFGWIRMEMDFFGIINQLSHLRYLKVNGQVTNSNIVTHQIKGLRHLETLDLSEIMVYSRWDRFPFDFVDRCPIDFVDLPRLSHLSVPRGSDTGLPCGIGDMKHLRTLHGIHLGHSSLESIIGLAEFIALLDFGFYLSKGSAPLAKKATWMTAIGTSLEKLRNLRRLDMDYNKVAWCVDAFISLSPSFNKIEILGMRGCTFSRVPRLIVHLQNLRGLSLGVKQMVQEDFAIIGIGAPSLLSLALRIAGILTERIVIRGSMGFASLKYFEFTYDCISNLSFEAGSMPELRQLRLFFDANKWDKATPGGLQHLPSLKKIKAQRSCYDTDEWWRHERASNKDENAEQELIKGVFQEAIEALPTRPTFIFGDGWLHRPIEKEECLDEVVD